MVDATRDATALWYGPIVSVLEDFVTRLPESQRPEIAFLGSSQVHPLEQVLRGLASEVVPPGPGLPIEANLGRYPVIGSLLWTLSKGPPRPLILMTTRPIPDLPDWTTPELKRRLRIYRLTGAERVTPHGYQEQDTSSDLDGLVQHLADPVASVRMGGTALPIDWNNDSYRWNDGRLEVQSGQELAVSVGFCGAVASAPVATVTRASGDVLEVPLSPTSPPPPSAPLPFTIAEGTVLGLWQRGLSFTCGHCRRSHPPGQVGCPVASESPLFPTLSALGAGIVCHVESQPGRGWTFRPIPRSLVAQPDGRILVWRSSLPYLLAFEEGVWKRQTDPLPTWMEVSPGYYLLRTSV